MHVFKIISFTCLCLAGCLLTQAQQPTCHKKNDVVFVVDYSGSITDNGNEANWDLILNFICDIVKNSVVSYTDTHFGLVTFGNWAKVRFRLNEYYTSDDVCNAVKSIPIGKENTNLYAGLHLARTEVLSSQHGGRENVPKVIIVITDGQATKNTTETIPEAERLHSDGVRIFAVGVTNNIKLEELKAVSSPPRVENENYWTTPDFSSLSNIISSVAKATCEPPKKEKQECQILDLVFAIDIAQDMNDCMKSKNFVKRFIGQYIPVGPQNVQVSVVTFDQSQATVQFLLNAHTSEDQVKQAIDSIPCTSSNEADPYFAFETIRNNVLPTQYGGRQNFKSVIVVMMDNEIPSHSKSRTEQSLREFRNLNARIVAVGASAGISNADLALMSSFEKEVVSVSNYGFLDSKLDDFGAIMCDPRKLIVVPCDGVVDVVFVLDQSTSIAAAPGGYDNWDRYMLAFTTSIAEKFTIDQAKTRVGVMKFNQTQSVAFHLNQYNNKEEVLRAISQLKFDGGDTNITGALRVARQNMFNTANGARQGVAHLLIFITDGRANKDAHLIDSESDATKQAGIEIFTVGVTTEVDMDQLRTIASDPKEGHSFYADDFSQLTGILDQLISQSCGSISRHPEIF